MGIRGIAFLRGSVFVLGFLALLGAAYAGDTSDRPVDESTSPAAAARKGLELAALEMAAQSNSPHWSAAPSEKELRCLAEAMYFEARGEPLRGQLAVGRVIMNRVSSNAYPNTICEVVYQNDHLHNRCQFSFACDGKAKVVSEHKVWEKIQGYAAWLLANGAQPRKQDQIVASLGFATHFHADYVNPHWAKHFTLTVRIGRHIFYWDPSAGPA